MQVNEGDVFNQDFVVYPKRAGLTITVSVDGGSDVNIEDEGKARYLFVVTHTDGPKRYIVVRATLGSMVETVSFTVDKVPPQFALWTGAAYDVKVIDSSLASSYRQVEIKSDGESDLLNCKLYVNGVQQSNAFSSDVKFTSAGSYRIRISDPAGNEIGFDFFIDAGAPLFDIRGQSSNKLYKVSDFYSATVVRTNESLIVYPKETGLTLTYLTPSNDQPDALSSFDILSSAHALSRQVVLLDAGAYTFTNVVATASQFHLFTVTDAASNVTPASTDAQKVCVFVIDQQIPNVSFTLVSDGSAVADGQVIFSSSTSASVVKLTINETVSALTVEAVKDGSVYTVIPGASSSEKLFAGAGLHRVTVSDRAGNRLFKIFTIRTQESVLIYRLDDATNKQQLISGTVLGGSSYSFVVELPPTLAQSNVHVYKDSALSTNLFVSLGVDNTQRFSTDGTYTIQVGVTDSLGNFQASSTTLIYIDTTAPVVLVEYQRSLTSELVTIPASCYALQLPDDGYVQFTADVEEKQVYISQDDADSSVDSVRRIPLSSSIPNVYSSVGRYLFDLYDLISNKSTYSVVINQMFRYARLQTRLSSTSSCDIDAINRGVSYSQFVVVLNPTMIASGHSVRLTYSLNGVTLVHPITSTPVVFADAGAYTNVKLAYVLTSNGSEVSSFAYPDFTVFDTPQIGLKFFSATPSPPESLNYDFKASSSDHVVIPNAVRIVCFNATRIERSDAKATPPVWISKATRASNGQLSFNETEPGKWLYRCNNSASEESKVIVFELISGLNFGSFLVPVNSRSLETNRDLYYLNVAPDSTLNVKFANYADYTTSFVLRTRTNLPPSSVDDPTLNGTQLINPAEQSYFFDVCSRLYGSSLSFVMYTVEVVVDRTPPVLTYTILDSTGATVFGSPTYTYGGSIVEISRAAERNYLRIIEPIESNGSSLFVSGVGGFSAQKIDIQFVAPLSYATLYSFNVSDRAGNVTTFRYKYVTGNALVAMSYATSYDTALTYPNAIASPALVLAEQKTYYAIQADVSASYLVIQDVKTYTNGILTSTLTTSDLQNVEAARKIEFKTSGEYKLEVTGTDTSLGGLEQFIYFFKIDRTLNVSFKTLANSTPITTLVPNVTYRSNQDIVITNAETVNRIQVEWKQNSDTTWSTPVELKVGETKSFTGLSSATTSYAIRVTELGVEFPLSDVGTHVSGSLPVEYQIVVDKKLLYSLALVDTRSTQTALNYLRPATRLLVSTDVPLINVNDFVTVIPGVDETLTVFDTYNSMTDSIAPIITDVDGAGVTHFDIRGDGQHTVVITDAAGNTQTLTINIDTSGLNVNLLDFENPLLLLGGTNVRRNSRVILSNRDVDNKMEYKIQSVDNLPSGVTNTPTVWSILDVFGATASTNQFVIGGSADLPTQFDTTYTVTVRKLGVTNADATAFTRQFVVRIRNFIDHSVRRSKSVSSLPIGKDTNEVYSNRGDVFLYVHDPLQTVTTSPHSIFVMNATTDALDSATTDMLKFNSANNIVLDGKTYATYNINIDGGYYIRLEDTFGNKVVLWIVRYTDVSIGLVLPNQSSNDDLKLSETVANPSAFLNLSANRPVFAQPTDPSLSDLVVLRRPISFYVNDTNVSVFYATNPISLPASLSWTAAEAHELFAPADIYTNVFIFRKTVSLSIYNYNVYRSFYVSLDRSVKYALTLDSSDSTVVDVSKRCIEPVRLTPMEPNPMVQFNINGVAKTGAQTLTSDGTYFVSLVNEYREETSFTVTMNRRIPAMVKYGSVEVQDVANQAFNTSVIPIQITSTEDAIVDATVINSTLTTVSLPHNVTSSSIVPVDFLVELKFKASAVNGSSTVINDLKYTRTFTVDNTPDVKVWTAGTEVKTGSFTVAAAQAFVLSGYDKATDATTENLVLNIYLNNSPTKTAASPYFIPSGTVGFSLTDKLPSAGIYKLQVLDALRNVYEVILTLTV